MKVKVRVIQTSILPSLSSSVPLPPLTSESPPWIDSTLVEPQQTTPPPPYTYATKARIQVPNSQKIVVDLSQIGVVFSSHLSLQRRTSAERLATLLACSWA